MTAPLFAALALTAGALAAQPQDCKLVRVDEWTVVPGAPIAIVEGRINGRRVPVLIDTGSAVREGALLHRALAQRLGVPVRPHPYYRMAGVGGETKVGIGSISEIRIGEARRRNWDVLVAGEGDQPFFIIGNQFFRDQELELDLSHERIRVFKSEACRGVSLAYWTRSPSVVPLWLDGWIYLDVLLNGKPVRAILDSGASTSIIDMSVLGRVGAESQLRTAPAGSCMRGLGKQTVASQIGEFESFALGDELIRNPKIHFADLRKDSPRTSFLFFEIQTFDMPEMILGADFLRAHRVLIARQHGRLFFTYEGGTVFPIGARQPCLQQAVEPKQ